MSTPNDTATTNETATNPNQLDVYAASSNMEVQDAILPSCSNLNNVVLGNNKKILRVKKSNTSSPSKLKSNLKHSKDFLKIKPFTIEGATLLKGLQVGRNKNSSNDNTNKLSLPLDNIRLSKKFCHVTFYA
jgi:hypothetical protein